MKFLLQKNYSTYWKSKLDKASKLGTKVIDESEFIKILEK